MSPVIAWLFLELWDTAYLLVTLEYVFVACDFKRILRLIKYLTITQMGKIM